MINFTAIFAGPRSLAATKLITENLNLHMNIGHVLSEVVAEEKQKVTKSYSPEASSDQIKPEKIHDTISFSPEAQRAMLMAQTSGITTKILQDTFINDDDQVFLELSYLPLWSYNV
ncbi:MAG: hypothetical protein FWF24_01520 [Alphaproteobacteria bacterium]|nr:hypothetical protein [Alphaproteobacteria bacterium]